jgi:hypothetical protein
LCFAEIPPNRRAYKDTKAKRPLRAAWKFDATVQCVTQVNASFALLDLHHSRQRQLIVFVGRLEERSWNETGCRQLGANNRRGLTMARDEHNIAAELRENVAKAHRKDPAKGHEHANTSKQQSQTAHQHSDQAHSKGQQQK